LTTKVTAEVLHMIGTIKFIEEKWNKKKRIKSLSIKYNTFIINEMLNFTSDKSKTHSFILFIFYIYLFGCIES